MVPSASLLLLLLLGLSQAQAWPAEFQEEEPDQVKGSNGDKSDDVDITTRILTANNGSDLALVEGDILAPTTRNAMKCWSNSCLWRKASNGQVMVPYVISNQFPANEQQLIENAMRGFAGTCVRFVRRTNEADYISIESIQGCYSALGRQGGRQQLSLQRGGCVYSGIAQHELNHALGFQHEQTRSDRDSYVRINWQNIVPSSAYNFQKQDTNNLNTPYDYGSIMHYGRDAFAIRNGLETITPTRNPSAQIGQRQALSSWDVKRINLLYGC